MAQTVKNLPAMQETWVRTMGWEDSLEKGMTTHSSIVVYDILLSAKEVVQSCPALCNPMDCRLPGSSVYAIFQARILEWVGISFSRRSSNPGIEPESPAL